MAKTDFSSSSPLAGSFINRPHLSNTALACIGLRRQSCIFYFCSMAKAAVWGFHPAQRLFFAWDFCINTQGWKWGRDELMLF